MYGAVRAIKWINDSMIFSGGDDATLRGWRISDGKLMLEQATDHKTIFSLESIAQQITDVLEVLDRSVRLVQDLYADGGATQNAQLMQLQANLIGRNVLRSENPDLSAMGVAHLAGIGAGFWNWDELARLPRALNVFQPNWSDARRAQQRQQWLEALSRARGHTRRI
jgi:glycerol kinase